MSLIPHTVNDLNTAHVIALADAHIRRFSNLLEQHSRGANGVRRIECMTYLEIWRSVLHKAESKDFAEAERNELQDAIDCGDYDHLLELISSDGEP